MKKSTTCVSEEKQGQSSTEALRKELRNMGYSRKILKMASIAMFEAALMRLSRSLKVRERSGLHTGVFEPFGNIDGCTRFPPTVSCILAVGVQLKAFFLGQSL